MRDQSSIATLAPRGATRFTCAWPDDDTGCDLYFDAHVRDSVRAASIGRTAQKRVWHGQHLRPYSEPLIRRCRILDRPRKTQTTKTQRRARRTCDVKRRNLLIYGAMQPLSLPIS